MPSENTVTTLLQFPVVNNRHLFLSFSFRTVLTVQCTYIMSWLDVTKESKGKQTVYSPVEHIGWVKKNGPVLLDVWGEQKWINMTQKISYLKTGYKQLQ